MKNHDLVVWTALFCVALLGGCSAHSPMILKNTTDSVPASETRYPVHQEKVFVTEQTLPPSVEYDLVATIDVGRIWYGSSGTVIASMANRARELGANAIIQVKTWRQPSGFSWAAPHGSGQAVRVRDPKALERSGVQGQWE